MLVSHLCDHDQRFPVVALDRECGDAAPTDLRFRPLDDGLDVRGVAVDAADDDQVLAATADEQLALVQKAEIAGP